MYAVCLANLPFFMNKIYLSWSNIFGYRYCNLLISCEVNINHRLGWLSNTSAGITCLTQFKKVLFQVVYQYWIRTCYSLMFRHVCSRMIHRFNGVNPICRLTLTIWEFVFFISSICGNVIRECRSWLVLRFCIRSLTIMSNIRLFS